MTREAKSGLRLLGERVIEANAGVYLPLQHRWPHWPYWFQQLLIHSLAATKNRTINYISSSLDEESGGRVLFLTDHEVVETTVRDVQRQSEYGLVQTEVWSRRSLQRLLVVQADQQVADDENETYAVRRIELHYSGRAVLRLPLPDRFDRAAEAALNSLYPSLIADLHGVDQQT